MLTLILFFYSQGSWGLERLNNLSRSKSKFEVEMEQKMKTNVPSLCYSKNGLWTHSITSPGNCRFSGATPGLLSQDLHFNKFWMIPKHITVWEAMLYLWGFNLKKREWGVGFVITGVLCNILIIFSWEFEKMYPNKVTKENKK